MHHYTHKLLVSWRSVIHERNEYFICTDSLAEKENEVKEIVSIVSQLYMSCTIYSIKTEFGSILSIIMHKHTSSIILQLLYNHI